MNVRVPFAITINTPLFQTTNPDVSLDCAAQQRSVDASVDDGTHRIIAASVNERRFYKDLVTEIADRVSGRSELSKKEVTTGCEPNITPHGSFVNGEKNVMINGWT